MMNLAKGIAAMTLSGVIALPLPAMAQAAPGRAPATTGAGDLAVPPGSSPTASGDPIRGRAGTGSDLGGGPTSEGTGNSAQTQTGGPPGGYPDRN